MGLSSLLKLGCLLTALVLTGCSQMPTSGPGRVDLQPDDRPIEMSNGRIQVVEVDDRVVRALANQRVRTRFSESLRSPGGTLAATIGVGDVVEVSIWEAPPATLFSAGAADVRGAASGSRPVVLPEQLVDRDGTVAVPFAGRIPAAGKRAQELSEEIARRLRGKANQPEVLVRVVRNGSSAVTVVGEVSQSIRMPLTPSGERLLDALAAAGGVKQSVNRITLQVTRGDLAVGMPLDAVIRDPQQNVTLQAGDVVTALYQTLSFTALGATGKNEEVAFEAQGISLAQALARVGGLLDSRSDAKGVFLFRLERADALTWQTTPVATTPDGRVPVVYRADLSNPLSFFAMQGFEVKDKDVLFVSNAPAAELQKFLNLVFSVVYPVLSTIQITQ